MSDSSDHGAGEPHVTPPLDLGQSEEESKADWPRLREANLTRTSVVDAKYNCAAWAVGIDHVQWWPYKKPYYWPSNVPREETVEAFLAAYATCGFASCDSGRRERGYFKLAIYTDESGKPTHVARQLRDGRWASKLGDLRDIEHKTLNDLAGGEYGEPVAYMRKRFET